MPSDAEPADSPQPASFETALADLGEIVSRLESGSLGLSDSIAAYERGVGLLRRLHEELAAEHERIAGGVDAAIDIGVVDEKIDPAHTRSKLTQALAEAPHRRGRHKNIPL